MPLFPDEAGLLTPRLWKTRKCSDGWPLTLIPKHSLWMQSIRSVEGKMTTPLRRHEA